MRALLVIAALTALAGCLESRTGTCGDLVCPVGRTCDTHRQTCVLPAQLTACENRAQGDACSFPGVDEGGCDTGVCHPMVCGNGIVERNEACDDENVFDLDGCNRTCTSNETCGNGVIDQLRGEECDDRNAASHDGCASSCRSEVMTWQEETAIQRAGLLGSAMAFDAVRGRLTRYGGRTPTSDDAANVEELEGERWSGRRDPSAPPGRSFHVMAYDTDRRRLVVFGGSSQGQVVGDTWVVDVNGWRMLPGPGPGPREAAAGVYVPGEHRLLVFGGRGADGTTSDETWALGAGGWQRLAPAASPSPRAGHQVVYDAHRQRVVLFGGRDGDTALTDTWEWTGSTWVPVDSAAAPARTGAMAYDATRRLTVLFGGDAGGADDETWEYDGDEWRPVSTSVEPVARQYHAAAYDPVSRQVIVVGGSTGVVGAGLTDTWAYDGSWTELTGALAAGQAPSERLGSSLAYHPLLREMVLAGGGRRPAAPGQPGTTLNETWTHDGETWSEPPVLVPLPDVPLSPSAAAGMVYDDRHARLVLVRAASGMGATMETWIFDGTVWWRLDTPVAPPARTGAALVLDRGRGTIVLIAGESLGTVRSDTWELDGDTWSETTPAEAPPPRAELAAAYDEARGKVVIYGGRTAGMAGTPLGDTWEYDGTRWTPITTAESPGPRFDSVLAYHPLRGTLILWGGITPPMPHGDIWEYDPNLVTWVQVAIDEGPGPMRNVNAAWDPARKQLFFAGGDPEAVSYSLAYRSSLPDESCAPAMEQPLADRDGDGLIGCDDPDCEAVACNDGNFLCRAGTCECVGGSSERACGDGFDDDCDGKVDCEDPDCAGLAPCQTEPSCRDGRDDDEDGRVDCLDPGCAGVDGCEAFESTCDDGEDNDGDGEVDCADRDCYLVACPEVLP